MVEVTLKSRRFSLSSLTQPVWESIKNELRRLTGRNILTRKDKPKNLSEISFNLTPHQFRLLKSRKIFVENAEIGFEIQQDDERNQETPQNLNQEPTNGHPYAKKVEKKGSRLINKKKVYISNIPAFITDELITSIFEQFGPVRNAYVCSSKRKGKFLYGFASFYEEDAVQRCLKNGVVPYQGYKMSVKIASERPETVSKTQKEPQNGQSFLNNINAFNPGMLLFNPLNAFVGALGNQSLSQMQHGLNFVAPVPDSTQEWMAKTNYLQRKNMNPYDRDQLKKKNYIRIGSKLLSRCEDNHCFSNLRVNQSEGVRKKKKRRRKVNRKSEIKLKLNEHEEREEPFDHKLKETLSFFC